MLRPARRLRRRNVILFLTVMSDAGVCLLQGLPLCVCVFRGVLGVILLQGWCPLNCIDGCVGLSLPTPPLPSNH